MINLLATIGLTTLLYIIFKAFDVFKINTFQAVVFNYITCVVVGSLFSLGSDIQPMLSDVSWIYLSVLMGGLFIASFYLMAWSAQKISVTVSTVSSKMSMVLPVIFSFVYLKIQPENVLFYVVGLVLALVSIYLSTKTHNRGSQASGSNLKYALLIFVLSGAVDTSINFANAHFGHISLFEQIFPITVFAMASCFGIVLLLMSLYKKKSRFSFKNALAGIALGIPNYFSIYFLMRTLSDFGGNGAFVFPLTSISVIVLSSLLAWLLFSEKLRLVNIIGIFCAIASICVISFSSLF